MDTKIKSKFFSLRFLFSHFAYSTGSGKSTLIRKIVRKHLKQFGTLKIYLVNVSQKDEEWYKGKTSKLKSITFSKLDHADNNSLIIVEDIISMNKKEEIHLRKALNYNAHHKQQKIICVSHMVWKTSMYSMLTYFHYIFFTSRLQNIQNVRITLNFFKIETILNCIANFVKFGEQGKLGLFFFFNTAKMSFNFITDIEKTIFKDITYEIKETKNDETKAGEKNIEKSQKIQNLQIRFDKFVFGLDQSNAASSIFSIIANCVNINMIREHDLTIIFKTKTNKIVRISLVDYAITMLAPTANVNYKLIVLHNYLAKFCYIPNIFLQNETFKRVQNRIKKTV